ncbi:MAG TPA: DUF4091 domain-containing protein [Chthonomonadales bacterium]|nr:DUF4091 domain-containing protein [Chthonomonadales bacterium]
MSDIACWLEDALHRVYPGTAASRQRALGLLAARGERVAFQVCVRNEGSREADVSVSVEAPQPVEARVRLVGLVPIAHLNTETEAEELEGVGHVPGLAPDPLLDAFEVRVGPLETRSFWVSLWAPPDAPPGQSRVRATVRGGEATAAERSVELSVSPVVGGFAQDFPVTHWFYADALCDRYGVEPWEERFWAILRPYMRNLAEHGGTCQYVPLFTPPTDGVKRPTQLLRVAEDRPGHYRFDFADVRRWVRMATESGARFLEWTHFYSQWGVRHAIRIYRDNADDGSLLWPPETGATDPLYRRFLAQFLPEFRAFLEAEGVLDRSFFHVSDEPHEEHIPAYRAARDQLRELAPWMRVMDALSNLRFGREGLTDIPVPSIATALQYREAGIPAWVYYCCGPRGRFVNRLTDTPLAKVRMNGWLFHRFGALGFLHWGYNYWHRSQTRQLIDPFVEQAGGAWPGWAYGDTFVVYPGPDGPLDSIRWEVFADSLQDLGLLRTLGVGAEHPILAPLESYETFPRSAEWVLSARSRLLEPRAGQ